MIALSGARVVLPDRLLTAATLVIEGDRISEVRPESGGGDPGSPLHHHYLVPGFIDVHVHGLEGFDTLDRLEGISPIAAMAARLPRYGVTAFCPTTVACAPEALGRMLLDVRRAREMPAAGAARVLPAHLESNFINDAFRGAQPVACLRSPRTALAGLGRVKSPQPHDDGADEFPASDVLAAIERAGADVGILTLAPELEGGLDLVRWATSRGLRVSLGHSAATFEQGLEAIAAGARQATHLFNRMPPLAHRAPGLAGAVLHSEEIAAELICDGYHVHPAIVRTAVAAKRPSRIMAITDGTAVSGLPVGSRGALGGQPIVAGDSAALLGDGTLAGSVLTMDRAFRTLVENVGLSIVDAATLCATTPARELGLDGRGLLEPNAIADIVVLDEKLSVVRTYIAGQLVYQRSAD